MVRSIFDRHNKTPGSWSLTLRMSVFASLALTIIVLAVSAMMYSELVRQLQSKEEAELLDNMQIQRDTLEHLLGRKFPPTQWQYEWREYQEQSHKFAWQLLAPNRFVRNESPHLSAFVTALAAPVRPGQYVRIDGPRQTWLVFDMAVETRGPEALEIHGPSLGPKGTVLRGIIDITQDRLLLAAYRNKLVAVIGAAILVSTWLGWLLARRSLAPVRAMSKEVGRISAEKLDARIAQQGWPIELQLLAESFDNTLARLAGSFEQLSRFPSDIAHEFRSPVNNLVAAASVTLARARTPAEYQKTLEVVVEEGSRLSHMVSSMLFLARTDNAEQHIHPEILSIGREFYKLTEFYGVVAEEQNVRLEAQGDGELVADPQLFRRALSNLLSNALRYTPPGGTVRLSAVCAGDRVTISVSDNGAGIAPEHLPFLFDRFYRVDAARSTTDSTGLGLAVVRSIALLHGGAAGVESTVGEGSTFSLHLPRPRPAP
ncbi:heavy metal sensor histidine kinase [Massilia sp. TN1-12]|uniref:heavy metal sensor histidine kinase n=1 Tax=Massilia paldalensis TaxID=3377675 RepID=UPI00384DA01E